MSFKFDRYNFHAGSFLEKVLFEKDDIKYHYKELKEETDKGYLEINYFLLDKKIIRTEVNSNETFNIEQWNLRDIFKIERTYSISKEFTGLEISLDKVSLYTVDSERPFLEINKPERCECSTKEEYLEFIKQLSK